MVMVPSPSPGARPRHTAQWTHSGSQGAVAAGAVLRARIAAAEANIPLPHVQKGEMTARDWERWAQHMGAVVDAPLWIDDNPHANPAYIRAECRRMAREFGRPLGLVIVDYLQLMTMGGKAENRQQEVSQISRALTILAKDLGCPALALSQLNRGSESRQDKKPVLSDLRESGSIEQDARQVILVHREDAYEPETPRAGEVDLIIAKNRGGPTKVVTLASQLSMARFKAMAADPEPIRDYGLHAVND